MTAAVPRWFSVAVVVSCAVWLATPTRADVPSPPDPNEPCLVEKLCPEVGQERFENPGTEHVETELRAQGLEKRCVRNQQVSRSSWGRIAVYCPVQRASVGCLHCAVGARAGHPRSAGMAMLLLAWLVAGRRLR